MAIRVRPLRPPVPDPMIVEFEVTGEDIAALGDIDDWCAQNVGVEGRDWTRESISSFADQSSGTYALWATNKDAVFAFRLRWCR